MTTSNDSGVLTVGNPADRRSFSLALQSQLTRAASVRASSGYTIVIDDPCYAPEESFRSILSAVSEVARQPNPEAGIRALLAQHLSPEQLTELKIFVSGKHQVTGGFVVAAGRAQVDAEGNGVLFGVDQAVINAGGNFEVYVTDDVALSAHGDVNVDASGRARIINSFDRVTGTARDKVRGQCRQKSQWTVGGEAMFDAHDNAIINGEGKAVIRLYGASHGRGKDRVKVTMFDNSQGWFVENADVELLGNAICYAEEQVSVRKKSLAARLFRQQDLEAFAWIKRAHNRNGCVTR